MFFLDASTRALPAALDRQQEQQLRLALDLVLAERTTVLQLLTGEDEALGVWINARLVFNFRLHPVDGGVRGQTIQCDLLPGEGPHEDVHASTEPTRATSRWA